MFASVVLLFSLRAASSVSFNPQVEEMLEYLKTIPTLRYLKHANGLLYFHSKKPEYLKQEIYANLILYNFGVFLANEAIRKNQKKKRRITNKYQYEVDFSSALKISRKYFIHGRSSESRIIKLIAKYIHAVKSEFRQFSRPLRGIGAIHFGYR